jgi:methanogenic corrinoid protein MtbC1
LPTAEVARGNIVITGIQGELHQVGANLVADVLEADGWDVCFLGTNVPLAGILTALETHHAAVLGISATMLFSLPQVRELIAAVRARFGPHSPRIVVGGGAFRQLPYLAAELGADGSATDVREVSAMMQAVLDAGPVP